MENRKTILPLLDQEHMQTNLNFTAPGFTLSGYMVLGRSLTGGCFYYQNQES